jgi:PIN domain nuclease of toxin-antitoxin system
MTLLLDTHVFLWAIVEPDQLSPAAHRALHIERNELVLSSVSLIEMAIKVQSGKLQFPLNRDYVEARAADLGVSRILSVLPSHAYAMATIPRLHGDPFDRLLVAQCVSENMRLVTADRMFRKYPIEVLW